MTKMSLLILLTSKKLFLKEKLHIAQPFQHSLELSLWGVWFQERRFETKKYLNCRCDQNTQGPLREILCRCCVKIFRISRWLLLSTVLQNVM